MHEMSIENGDILLRICCFLIMLRGGETQKKVNQNKTVGDSLTTTVTVTVVTGQRRTAYGRKQGGVLG